MRIEKTEDMSQNEECWKIGMMGILETKRTEEGSKPITKTRKDEDTKEEGVV